MENPAIKIIPIGEVYTDVSKTLEMPLVGEMSAIQIYPEYADALERLEEHSHYWILCWFHQASREKLRVKPVRMNDALPRRGVFSIRSPHRPNPIGLTLIELHRIDGTTIHVSGLDAIAGTPVLDIKPYYEQDLIFSPRTPYIRPQDEQVRRELFFKQILNHHRENCVWTRVAVKMAMIADEALGQLQSENIKVAIHGPDCLVDCIQGITRARLVNPCRLEFRLSSDQAEVIWTSEKSELRTYLSQIPTVGKDGVSVDFTVCSDHLDFHSE